MEKMLGEIHPKVKAMFLACATVERHGIEGGNYNDQGKLGIQLVAQSTSAREQFFNETLPAQGVTVDNQRVSPITYFGENRLMGLVCVNDMANVLQEDARMEQATALTVTTRKGPSLG